MISTYRYSIFQLGTLLAASAIISACGSSDEGTSVDVTVSAKSLASLNATTNLSASRSRKILGQSAGLRAFAGPESPDYSNGEYDGMGVVSSNSVVDSFKVHITKITFGTGTPGISGGTQSELTFDKEIQIANGVNEAVNVTGSMAANTYKYAAVGFKPSYKLKAYAYFDTDNNGTIDTTVFTKATEIKKSTGRLTATQLAADGYAEYSYGHLFSHCSNSVTASTDGECGTFSVFPEPLVITADTTPTVSLLIDTTNIVAGWTGDLGNYVFAQNDTTSNILGDSSKVPQPVNFPISSTCSDTPNSAGLNSCDFWPVGSPNFRLSYIPAFAFVDTTGLTSQVYVVSKESGVWNHFNSATMQLVFKGADPQLGLINGPRIMFSTGKTVDFTITPVLGSVARLFSKEGDTYSFAMDGGATDATGTNDGGLYYNNDSTMAGYLVEGFTPTAIDGTGTITVKDGPRCNSEDYNFCIGTRTYYIKRIK